MKNENKIRKYLGDRYHLHITLGGEKMEVQEWKLFRKYPGYLTDGSEAIMTSETHSEKDLLKFAKRHKQFDSEKCIINLIIIASWVAVLLILVGIYLNIEKIKIFAFGIDFTIFLIGIPMIIIYNHNIGVDRKEVNELLEELEEMREQDE